MNLTITQADNDESLATDPQGINLLSMCPTAIAYAKAKGLKVGSVVVGYCEDVGSIAERGEVVFGDHMSNIRPFNKPMATFKGDLLKAVQDFTRERPRPPILGTFTIDEV